MSGDAQAVPQSPRQVPQCRSLALPKVSGPQSRFITTALFGLILPCPDTPAYGLLLFLWYFQEIVADLLGA